MVTAIAGAGTPESDWQSWQGLHRFPPLDLAGCDRVVLLAPHPDDEILGAGGLLRLLSARGATVEVVAITDGEASHPDSGSLTPERLAVLRRKESLAALGVLGLGAATVHRLGVGDGAVTGEERTVAAAIDALLAGASAGTWCVSTWDGDGHPDHEAVGRVARAVSHRYGVRLLMYPIWTWHWAVPGDPRVPWSRARSIALDDDTHAAKLAAVDCFASQIRPLSPEPEDAPVLTAGMLERLRRRTEVVLT
ncbi:MAG: PIG-L family deacetylase [Geodermatophilaceae bacterium]|nr:PIG-L family deacetylase [Geodermatophilaceae bacterium]MDQ3463699.1 PIG-L family deacetylase [Actinomycetota bacterium]